MDRGRLKKMGKKSCFFVYKSGDADVEKKNPEINFVKALSAVCAVLWKRWQIKKDEKKSFLQRLP